MNAIGYIRVSTDAQAGEDRFGIEAQKEQISKYASDHSITIVDWMKDEISGTKDRRPAFDQIIYGDITNPPYEAVIVAKNDRIARDINVYFFFKMMLKKKNIALISISEDFGQFGVFSSILEAFTMCVAEMERDNINKRTSMGRGVKASQGGYSGGRPPFGYTVQNKQLLIVPEEAKLVSEIFKMNQSGATLQAIADFANESGLKTHNGSEFRTSTIQTILANRKMYEGYYRYGKQQDWVKGLHEPILNASET